MKMSENASMSTKIWMIILIIVCVMHLLPFAVIHLFLGDTALAIILLLVYFLNPIFVFIIGYWSGKQWRKTWYLPLAAALIFLLSSWILFTHEEILYVYYALAYLGIGMMALWLSAYSNRKGNSRQN